MFKWILIFLVAFLGVWFFGNQYIPQSVNNTGFAKMLDVATFSIDYKINGSSFIMGRFDKVIKPLDEIKLKRALTNLNIMQKPVVIFFYEPGSLLSRANFSKMNDLAKAYSGKNIFFFFVAFEDDDKKLRYYLNKLPSLYFSPYIIPSADIKFASIYMAEYGMKLDSPNKVIYKSSGREYTNLGLSFETSNELEYLIINDIKK